MEVNARTGSPRINPPRGPLKVEFGVRKGGRKMRVIAPVQWLLLPDT